MRTQPRFKKGDSCVLIGEVGRTFAVLDLDFIVASDPQWYDYAAHPEGGYWQYEIEGRANSCPDDHLQLRRDQKVGDILREEELPQSLRSWLNLRKRKTDHARQH